MPNPPAPLSRRPGSQTEHPGRSGWPVWKRDGAPRPVIFGLDPRQAQRRRRTEDPFRWGDSGCPKTKNWPSSEAVGAHDQWNGVDPWGKPKDDGARSNGPQKTYPPRSPLPHNPLTAFAKGRVQNRPSGEGGGGPAGGAEVHRREMIPQAGAERRRAVWCAPAGSLLRSGPGTRRMRVRLLPASRAW